MIFSGAQLHSTVPNSSGRTRYSIDFRIVNLTDVRDLRGAANVDSRCTGSTMQDYLRCSDLSKLPTELTAPYDDGPPQRAVEQLRQHPERKANPIVSKCFTGRAICRMARCVGQHAACRVEIARQLPDGVRAACDIPAENRQYITVAAAWSATLRGDLAKIRVVVNEDIS